MPTEDVTIFAIDLDWCSSGLWIYRQGDKRWGNIDYESVDMPQWLVSRFDFWTDWYNRKDPRNFDMRQDESDEFAAYGFSLAIDLCRHLTETFEETFEVRNGRTRKVSLHQDALESPAPERHLRSLPRPNLAQIVPKSRYLKPPEVLMVAKEDAPTSNT